jgi:hypothetical protein
MKNIVIRISKGPDLARIVEIYEMIRKILHFIILHCTIAPWEHIVWTLGSYPPCSYLTSSAYENVKKRVIHFVFNFIWSSEEQRKGKNGTCGCHLLCPVRVRLAVMIVENMTFSISMMNFFSMLPFYITVEMHTETYFWYAHYVQIMAPSKADFN